MWTARSTKKNYRQGPIGLLAALALSTLLTGCSISDLLEVDLPGVIKTEDLNDPALAPVLVDGVIGSFECAWSNYTTVGSMMAGEWIGAGGGIQGDWWRRKTLQDDRTFGIGNCLQFYGIFTPLQTARYQNETVYELLAGFDSVAVPRKLEYQGIVRAYGGYALLALGEGFCEMAIDGGPRMTRAEVFQLAEDRFDEAIDLLQGTTNTSVLNMALVGRARIKIDQQDWPGALADATAVPVGFVRTVPREDTVYERRNKILALGLQNTYRLGSVANHYRDLRIAADGTPTSYCDALGVSPAAPCDGPQGAPLAPGEVADPRVVVVGTTQLTRDGSTPFFGITKFTTLADDLPLATYAEAQLYVAEAEAHLGNLDNAIAAINGIRPAGVPRYVTPTTLTQTEVIGAVLEERRRVQFVVASSRWNDMIRYDGTANAIPWVGEPGSIYPNGRGASGEEYGTNKCMFLPIHEINGNPNLHP
jgi:hypothetical protein